MARIKTPEDISRLREGGHFLAQVLLALSEEVRPGKNIRELNQEAQDLIHSLGGKPSFLGYKPAFSSSAFPAALCVSVNEEVVHGFGSRDRVLKEGDIVGLDIGMEYKGLFTDTAATVGAGKITKEDRKLLGVTKRALEIGILAVRPGVSVAEVGRKIQRYVEENGFSVVRSLVGHGVGHAVHEDPPMPNYFEPSLREEMIEEGMVLALEPMVNAGSQEVETAEDGWTILTKDRKKSAHFEHTIFVTHSGAEILTQ